MKQEVLKSFLVARRSIILYYFTKDPKPPTKVLVEKPHSSLWKKRVGQIKEESNQKL